MKKLFLTFLSFALLCSMSVTALAAEKIDTFDSRNEGAQMPFTATGDVKVLIEGETTPVYYVTVEWDSLQFTYKFDSSNDWDPTTHTYSSTSSTDDGWGDKRNASIKVTNHSNAAVRVAGTIDTPEKNGVKVSLTTHDFDLNTAVGREVDEGDSGTIGVEVSGVPTIETDFTVGKITVAISAKQ